MGASRQNLPTQAGYCAVAAKSAYICLLLLSVRLTSGVVPDFTCYNSNLFLSSSGHTIAGYMRGSHTGAGVTFERALDTGGGQDLPAGSYTILSSSISYDMLATGGATRFGAYNCIFSSPSVTITTLVLSVNGDVTPALPTLTANVGEDVVLRLARYSGFSSWLRWKHDGDNVTDVDGRSTVTLNNVQVSDAGIYECYRDGYYSQQRHALMKLIIRECPANKWGPSCSNNCVFCHNGGMCDDKTGDCICAPGFSGDFCQVLHGKNCFGQDCDISCACRDSLLCLPDPFGCTCAASYTGLDCHDDCADGYFGAGCKLQCHCEGGVACDKGHGRCPDGVECAANYRGENCQNNCPIGQIGDIIKDCITCQVPQAVGSPSITGSGTSRTLTWTPTPNMCSVIDYTIEVRLVRRDQCQPQSGSFMAIDSTVETSFPLSQADPNLYAYSTYEIRVRARNEAGLGASHVTDHEYMYSTSEKAPTAAPANVRLVAAYSNSLRFSWDEVPCGSRGGDITKHTYRLEPISGGLTVSGTVNLQYVMIRNLPSCTTHGFQVAAKNDGIGEIGVYSSPLEVSTRAKAHGPIRALAGSPSTSQIHITWTSPDTSDNKCRLYYIVEYELTNKDQCDIISPQRIHVTNQTDTSITLTGLEAYSTYKVYVRTWNEAGYSVEKFSEQTTLSKEPSESPADFRLISRLKDNVTLSWDEIPCGSRHGQIMEYAIKYRVLERPYVSDFRPSADTYTSLATGNSSRRCQIRDLEPSTKYEFLVAGVNVAGMGNWTVVDAFTSVETEMDRPRKPSFDTSKPTSPTVTIGLNLPSTSQYITGIQIGVQRVQQVSKREASDTRQPKSADSAPDYVAGELSKDNISQAFVVGDGKTYRGYYNKPLQNDTVYDICLGSVSRISDTEYYVVWGEPLRVTVKIEQPFPVVAVVVPVIIFIGIGVVIAGVTFRRRKTRQRNADNGVQFVATNAPPDEPQNSYIDRNEHASTTRTEAHAALKYTDYSVPPPKLRLVDKKHHSYENMPAGNPTYVESLKTTQDTAVYCNAALCGDRLQVFTPNREESPYSKPRPITIRTAPEPKASPTCPTVTPKPKSKPKPKPRSKTVPDKAHGPIPLDEFTDYVRQRKVTSFKHGNGFRQDFENLPNRALGPSPVGKRARNRDKNRYVNIVPYDDSRVVLEITRNDPDSDYVNASYIDGVHEVRKYIASQGPNKASVADMWRMVWQENTAKIVMLTNLQEGTKGRCDKYWPDDTESYGNITVRLTSEKQHADYIVRDFTLAMQSKGQMKVLQYQFTAWLDGDLPPDCNKLVNFIKTVKTHSPEGAGPMIVHCSTGTGRTGLFIALDSMLDQAEREGKMDIWSFVSGMRNSRMEMIRAATQYEFMFDALVETLQCGDTSIPPDRLRTTFSALKRVKTESTMTGLQLQFETLDLVTTRPNSGVCRTGKSAPHLQTSEQSKSMDDPDGLLDSYSAEGAFIVTRMPLPQSFGEILRTVSNYNASCIVMLNSLEDATLSHYLPSGGSTEHGDLTTTTESTGKLDRNVTVRYLALVNTKTKEARTVCHLQLRGWPNGGAPASPQSVLKLVTAVHEWQRNHKGDKVVVHCVDGEGASGTFCALLNIVERLKDEGVIDVFQAVKTLRATRSRMVPSLELYTFLYEAVLSHLDDDIVYENNVSPI